MFCPSCGSALKVDGDRDILYCPYCGAELPDNRVSINRNYNTNYEHKDININRRNEEVKKEVDWTIIALVGMMLLMAVIFMAVGGAFG